MGYEPTFFGVDGMDGILTIEGFDTSLAEGVMLLTPFSADATDEQTVTFVAKYQEPATARPPTSSPPTATTACTPSTGACRLLPACTADTWPTEDALRRS